MQYDPDQYLPDDPRGWRLIRDRALHKGQIFVSKDGREYLRIGPSEVLQLEIAFSKKLNKLGFPVPEITTQGELGDTTYFVECSVGSETFGRIFRREFESSGRVSDDSFLAYCETTRQFIAAQLRNAVVQADDLNAYIHLEEVLRDSPSLDAKQLRMALAKIQRRISHLPNVLTHGDLTPFNVLVGGIIDFERSFRAPIGYDVLTGVLFGRLWNFIDSSGHSKLSYDFSDHQIKQYNHIVDDEAARHGVDNLSSYTDDFLLLKVIWALADAKSQTAASSDDSKWRFRRAVLGYCLEQYCANEPIDSKVFGRLTY